MSRAVWLALGLLAFLLETQVTLFQVHPNASTVLVYAFAITSLSSKNPVPFLSSPELRSTCFGAFVGSIGDLLSGSSFGPELLGKGFIGFVTPIAFTDIFFRWNSVIGALVLFSVTVLGGVIAISVRLLMADGAVSVFGGLQTILIQAALNTVLGALIKPPSNTE